MPKIYALIFSSLILFSSQIQACDPIDSAQSVVKYFSQYKIFEHQQETIIFVTDQELHSFLQKDADFKTILTLPTIQRNIINGTFVKFLEEKRIIQESGQGVETFAKLDTAREQPFYVGTTKIFNCVTIV